MAKLRKYETHPKISMSALARHGLFDPQNDEPLGFYSGGSGMLISYSPSAKQIQLYFDTRFEPRQMVVVHQIIDIRFARTKEGPQLYFVCPDSGVRCQELHLTRIISCPERCILISKETNLRQRIAGPLS